MVVFILSLLSTALCFAEESATKEPLWEIGVAGATIRLPHYRGSDEYTWWTLPLPYIVYRGDILKATREGVRGICFDSEYFEASISLSGNPPVDNDNEARSDMPELDAIFEVGPALKLFLMDRNYVNKLYFKGSLRAATSINFEDGMNLAYQGLNSGIDLVYRNRQFYELNGFEFNLKAGINVADRKLSSYFYDVSEEYATPDRSSFESEGGYAGFSMSGSLKQDITKNVSIGLYTRWDNMDGAVYADSPLVREKNNFIVGCVLIWTLARSSHMVVSDE